MHYLIRPTCALLQNVIKLTRKIEMDEQAGSSMDTNGANNEDEIQWRFSQIKGNIETEDAPTDGLFLHEMPVK